MGSQLKLQSHRSIDVIIVVVLCIGGKWWYTAATNDSLFFILSPLCRSLEILTGAKAHYSHEFGFHFEEMKVLVDKSCSGFNFLIISFGSFYTLIANSRVKTLSKRIQFLVPAIALAYLATLVANISRILISMQTSGLSLAAPWMGSNWFHQSVGSFVYVFMLTLFYFILKDLSKNNSHNA